MKKVNLWLKVFLLLAISALTFVYAMFQGGFVSWFLFYVTNLVLLINWCFILMPIGDVVVNRRLSAERIVSGENLRVTITIERKTPFPFLFFIVEDIIPEEWRFKNKTMQTKEIVYPTFEKHLVFTYHLNELNRGEYEFSKISIKTGDLFGLFIKEKTILIKNQVVVYPNYQELNKWNLYNENEAEAYLTSQRIIEDITSVAGSREYVPGDRLTSIDWKVTARVNKLMTKEFEEYLGQRFLIALDCSLKGKQDVLIFEKAVELATSFTVQSFKEHFHLGLLTVSDKVTSYQIHYGEAHQTKMLEHLAKINFHFGNSFDFLFVNEMNKITTDTIVVMISTRLTDVMLENILRLKKKRVQVAFCFVTGNRKLTEQEKSKLSQLMKNQVSYYTIGNDSFKKDLQGGEYVAKS